MQPRSCLWTVTRFCLKVQDHIENLVREHFNDDFEVVMRDPILFGDFRLALQEGEPRIYEDIQDYEAAKALFEVWTAHLRLVLPEYRTPGLGCVWGLQRLSCL